MFGLGKKSATSAPGVLAEAAAAAPKIEVSDEQFIVMPEEYLPKAAAPSGDKNKKLILLIAGAAVFLIALSGGLYWWLFVANNSQEAVTVEPPAANREAADNAAASSTPAALKVITSQAYDAVGQLLGSLNLSLPVLVSNKYGEALGITVLAANDINLPAGQAIAGGVYSPYPVGAVFDEPVSAEITAAALATPESRQNYYPAWLKGTVWQAITPATASASGWSFSFDKFPSGPISLVERTATTTTTTIPVLGASAPAPSLDTDSDGLTDMEETLLGTNVAAADTDSDTYSDRAEIFSGYSPLLAKEKLENANLFATYTNPTYGYKAPYPKKWLADSLDQTNKQVLFISATEEFFEILVEENPLKKPIVDWYRSQSPTLTNVELDVTVVDGAAAVWSPDKLTLYAGKDGLVFILTYNKGTLEQINWPALFEYFYKNFKFGNTASQSTTPTPPPPVLP